MGLSEMLTAMSWPVGAIARWADWASGQQEDKPREYPVLDGDRLRSPSWRIFVFFQGNRVQI